MSLPLRALPRSLAVTAIAAATAMTSACVSVSVDDFAGTTPTFRLEDYFLGSTTAHGVFEDRFNKVRRTFVVEMTGVRDGDTLTLDERFTYNDGETDQRIWTIEILPDGSYRGRADDVIGVAEGSAQGYALNWTYKVLLPVNGKDWKVGFDDWMYQVDDTTVMNRAYVTRWGVRIGEVSIAFSKD